MFGVEEGLLWHCPGSCCDALVKLVCGTLTVCGCCLCLPACVCWVCVCSLVPLCDVLTPNQFEAELLTGMSVTTEQQALQAAEALHKKGPHTVVSRLPGQTQHACGSGGTRGPSWCAWVERLPLSAVHLEHPETHLLFTCSLVGVLLCGLAHMSDRQAVLGCAGMLALCSCPVLCVQPRACRGCPATRRSSPASTPCHTRNITTLLAACQALSSSRSSRRSSSSSSRQAAAAAAASCLLAPQSCLRRLAAPRPLACGYPSGQATSLAQVSGVWHLSGSGLCACRQMSWVRVQQALPGRHQG